MANGTLIARDAKTGKEVARVKTDKDVRFKLQLPAGEYKVECKYNMFIYNQTVKITAGQWLKLKAVFRLDPNYRGPLPPAL